jgi:hypothetical protein
MLVSNHANKMGTLKGKVRDEVPRPVGKGDSAQLFDAFIDS